MKFYESDDSFFKQVAKELSRIAGVPFEQIRPDSKLSEFENLDSLGVVELVMHFEDLLPRRQGFQSHLSIDKLETVRDLVELLRPQ